MRISAKAWAKYIKTLAAVDQKAADLMTAYIEEHGMDDGDELIRYAFAVATKYGEAAAAAACEMYDATAMAQGANVPPAEPAPTATYGEVAKAVNGTMAISEKLVPQAVSRTVKMAGADTMLQNAERDGAQFAWVPMGDTCAFCLTLASRGWQYMSKDALKGGHAEHIHANCDCQYAVRFDSKSGVAGYDPEKYREMYDNAEGSTPAEKIRAMRRDIYAEKVMHTYADPMREKMGSAYDSHPKEMKRIEKQLKGKGVAVEFRDDNMGYSPSLRGGAPGTIIMDPNASYSAWLHELKHLHDDEESGWKGFHLIQDPETFARMEDAAYDIEIDFARKNGYNRIARRLERLKFERRQEILGVQRNNRQVKE